MIVKDQNWSLEQASRIGARLTDVIHQEIEEFKGEDDASEIIYLIGHSTANYLARILSWFEQIGVTYDIDMGRDKTFLWIAEIAQGTLIDKPSLKDGEVEA